jgi:hypothetical protein
MDTAAIFALIEKGLTLLPLLLQAGVTIEPKIEQLVALAKGGAAGTLTDDDIAKIRSELDSDLADFNEPLPPAAA